MPSSTIVCPRHSVAIHAGTVVETVYRRAGNAPKPLTLYVLATSVFRGQARLLATADPSDVSDGKLFLAYADSCSKLASRTTVSEWDISAEEVEAVLKDLYFFDTFSSAYRQVQHVDTSDAATLIEAEQGYGAVPFSDIQTENVTVSLIETCSAHILPGESDN